MIRIVERGIVPYEEAMREMDRLHAEVVAGADAVLICCEHEPVYTVGSDPYPFDIPTVQSDRGGSITYHAPGQLIWYFLFPVSDPPRFYRKVVGILREYLRKIDPAIQYDTKRPGFYLQNRKLLSLGFRYRQGVSRHGIALNVDLDLAPFRKIRPCNLEGVVPTSLKAEGFEHDREKIRHELTREIVDGFTL